MERLIGIDFGTSTTYMQVKRYNGTQPLEDKSTYMPVMFNYGESSGCVASIVRENADGSFDFGEKAAEPLEGSRVYTEIKMRLESVDEEERAQARRIVRAFFRFLYETYAQQAGNLGSADDTEETLVSYPVKWKEETAAFMLEAAREAGFQNVHGMDEAAAAMHTVLCQNNAGQGVLQEDAPGYLLLVDMGAGTTDLVVCRYGYRDGQLQVQKVTSWPQDAGEPTFGGREIDTVLEGYVEAYLEKGLNPALAGQAHIIATAPGQAKMWKEWNVSVTLGAGKTVNTCAYIGTYKTMGMLTGTFPSFDRQAFEAFAGDGLRAYVRLLKGCLQEAARLDAGFAASGLDAVILTGGHSAWYFAREIVDGQMTGWLEDESLEKVRADRSRVFSLANPQTTVCLGLVYSRLPVGKGAQKTENREEEAATEKASAQAAPETTQANTQRIDPPDVQVAQVKAPSAEETVTQEPAHDWTESAPILSFAEAEAYYHREAVEFLHSIAYVLDEQQKQQARKELQLPEQEDILFYMACPHDGTVTYCALTENGLYLKGTIMTGKIRHISWTEFVQIQWGTPNFLTILKTDPKSLLESNFGSSPLKTLHDHLRTLPVQTQGTQERCTETAKLESAHVPAQPYTPIDRSVCPNCGTPFQPNQVKCPVCGGKARKAPKLPFKMNMVSIYKGETKVGLAKATGNLTIFEDRLEFKRYMGNAAAALTPYTLAYSLVKANQQPKDIFWMRDIVDVKEGKYAAVFPCLIFTLRTGEVYTLVAPLGTQAWHASIEDSIELIQTYKGC